MAYDAYYPERSTAVARYYLFDKVVKLESGASSNLPNGFSIQFREFEGNNLPSASVKAGFGNLETFTMRPYPDVSGEKIFSKDGKSTYVQLIEIIKVIDNVNNPWYFAVFGLKDLGSWQPTPSPIPSPTPSITPTPVASTPTPTPTGSAGIPYIYTHKEVYALGETIGVTAGNKGKSAFTYTSCGGVFFSAFAYGAPGTQIELHVTNPLLGRPCQQLTLEPLKDVTYLWDQTYYDERGNVHKLTEGTYYVAFQGKTFKFTVGKPTSTSTSVVLTTNKRAYALGEGVEVSATNNGKTEVRVSGCGHGYSIIGSDGTYLTLDRPSQNVCDGFRTIAPGETTVLGTWDQTYLDDCRPGKDFNAVGSCTRKKAAAGYYSAGFEGATAKFVILDSDGNPPNPPEDKPSITVALTKGWNMVSVPVYSFALAPCLPTSNNCPPASRTAELVESTCDSKIAWAYVDKAYQKTSVDSLSAGVGYWVKASNDCKMTFSGESELTSSDYSMNLQPGWNLIGAPRGSTPFSTLSNDCRVTSGPWYYGYGEYQKFDRLDEGRAYWVKVANSCTLVQSAVEPTPYASPSPIPTPYGSCNERMKIGGSILASNGAKVTLVDIGPPQGELYLPNVAFSVILKDGTDLGLFSMQSGSLKEVAAAGISISAKVPETKPVQTPRGESKGYADYAIVCVNAIDGSVEACKSLDGEKSRQGSVLHEFAHQKLKDGDVVKAPNGYTVSITIPAWKYEPAYRNDNGKNVLFTWFDPSGKEINKVALGARDEWGNDGDVAVRVCSTYLIDKPASGAPSSNAVARFATTSGSDNEYTMKLGDTLRLGGKILKLVSISPIATGSLEEYYASFELLNVEQTRIDFFSISESTEPYQNNGVFVDAKKIVSAGEDQSYAVVIARAIESTSCSDSDGGRDYYVKGHTVDLTNDYWDVCERDSSASSSSTSLILYEYSCRDGRFSSESYYCYNGCSNGHCLKPSVSPVPTPQPCTDSDGGMDYRVRGTVTGREIGGSATVTKTDYCQHNAAVVEFFCTPRSTEGGVVYEVNNAIHDCTSSCVEGACVSG